MTTLILK